MRALSASQIDVMAYGLITGDRQFIGYNPENMSEIRRTLPSDDVIFQNWRICVDQRLITPVFHDGTLFQADSDC